MKKWVSIKEKQQFLKWFLEKHRLKRLDARVLLDYILKQHHLLEKVSFGEKIQHQMKNLVISSIHSDKPGFQFHYQQNVTDQVARAMAELMAHPTERINIILHFNGKMFHHQYTQLVGNPELENIRRYERFEQYAREANILFDKIKHDSDIINIKKKIDNALDQKDEELFIQLVHLLKELENKT
jgi:uncharacterized protein YpiB (UPF0302 family)